MLFSINFTFSQVEPISADDGRTIKIPVVFHVIQEKGKSQDVHEKITDEVLKKEIQDLNINFSAQNNMSALDVRFENLIGNPNFEFYLFNPEHEGYIWRYDLSSNVSSRPIFGRSWKILHIVIGDMLSSSNVLLDNNSINKPNHININYKLVGNGSNTVTHELGHYFGLWHVWGKSNCKKIKFHKRTDFIADTPKQNNCTDVKRTKPCPPKKISKNPNYNNFMDYSSCRCFFTKDQVQTMRNRIIKYKKFFQESK
ncbi:hypothetical protein BTO14_10125 [Polaribacter butkevichii]|uniref:Peptidase M43 pregnancy-associated plasma-A domain-containing protein n=2 Tax=Polaribacter butkevichii TaxID=218490 RepID=A0A2P6CFB4_9FLAO|nr:hypothetical protein BTO14_10125 [Polaribacter butkevichii]